MAAPKPKVRVTSVALDFSEEKSSSRVVKASIRVEAVQTSDIIITIPVVIVFDVQGAGAKLDVRKMEELILAVFCGPERKADIVFIDGCVRVKCGLNGVTKFKSGLRSAIEVLKQRPSSVGPGPGHHQHWGFIILLSDGGSKLLEDDPALCKDLRQHPVHAIGLGSNHDSEVLQSIVSSSEGTYSYIPVTDDKEKLNREVLKDMAKCLGGLTTVVAVDTCVKISVPKFDRTKGWTCCTVNKELKIAEIHSGAYRNRITPNGREGKISIDYLYAGEVKQFIVHLAFTPGSGACELTAAVETHNKQQQAKRTVPFIVNSNSLEYTELKQQLGRNPNPAVLEHMIRSAVVQMLDRFTHKDQGGSKEKGQRLRQSWKELLTWLEGGNLGMAAAHLQKTYNCSLIKEIGMDIEAMASFLERGWGLGCIYSWLSSYEMQRPTTMGLPPPPPAAAAATPFLTPDMEKAERKVSKHLQEQVHPQASPPAGGGAAGSSSSSSRTSTSTGTSIGTTLDDDTKCQRAKKLLDSLVPLIEQKDKILLERPGPSSSNHKSDSDQQHRVFVDTFNIWKQMQEVVKAAINGTPMTTTSGSGHKEMLAANTTLDDRMKSAIAIWLFDRIIELNKGSYKADDLSPIIIEIYEVAKEAVRKWKKVIREDHPDGKTTSGSGCRQGGRR